VSPTGDDTPQQGGSLEGSQPDPEPFNPKEISVDKNVPWQKSDPPPFDQKDGLFKHYGQFGHEQNSGGGPDNSDGLSDHWEENQSIDINTDGQEVGGDGDVLDMDKHARVKVQFHWDREGKPSGDAPGHEIAHVVQQDSKPDPKQGGDGVLHEVGHWTGLKPVGPPDPKAQPKPLLPIIVGLSLLAVLLAVIVITFALDDDSSSTGNVSTPEPTESTSSGSQPVIVPPGPSTGGGGQTTGGGQTGGGQTTGGGDQPTEVVNQPPPPVPTEPPAECAAGWLPVSGCTCCGTTLTCADGTVAEFNPQCGVGGSSGGGGCQCVCPVGNPNCVDSCTGAVCTP